MRRDPPAGRLHVGVVGAGRIGAFHAETLRALEAVARVTVADALPGRGDVTSAEQLVEAGVDALVIATPTGAHADLLRLAAAAGLPAFCEKPVALELEALDRVAEDVARAGILVQVGFQRRFDRGFRAARDAVAAGSVGRVLVVRAATHDPSPPSEEYIAGSGGIFRDLHIHDLDAVRFVTGQEIVEVYADGAALETPWFADHGDVDAAVAVLTLESGTLAVLTGTRHDPLGYDVRLEVFGTGDSLAVGLDERMPLHAPDTPARPGYRDFLDRFADAYRAELAVFVESVRTGGPSACTLEEARAALAAAVAADRSRVARRPVRAGADTALG
ncbi:MAG TPA: Gfo/Idh/MocA family oxidoreductase [Gaiellaceae bacterium]